MLSPQLWSIVILFHNSWRLFPVNFFWKHFFSFYCYNCFLRQGSSFSTDWPQSYYVAKASLKLPDPPSSVSQLLRWQMCASMSGFYSLFWKVLIRHSFSAKWGCGKFQNKRSFTYRWLWIRIPSGGSLSCCRKGLLEQGNGYDTALHLRTLSSNGCSLSSCSVGQAETAEGFRTMAARHRGGWKWESVGAASRDSSLTLQKGEERRFAAGTYLMGQCLQADYT